MLNISKNSIRDHLRIEDFSSYRYNRLPAANKMLRYWLLLFFIIFLIVCFLPWTQNIQMKGKVTTLRPEQRPQEIYSALDGRIEEWYVQEGQLVQAGDTLAHLTEVKSDYLDPNLIENIKNQVLAKQQSAESYDQKVAALDAQIAALRNELILKKQQLENKLAQNKLKIKSNEAAVVQLDADYKVAEFQLRRTDTLFQKGIKSLSDLEAKRLKLQEVNAKRINVNNKLEQSRNEATIAALQLQNLENEYNNKIAKAQSDKFATLSSRFETEGQVNKLENQYQNYRRRNDMYYVTAPQAGYITKALKAGKDEIVKVGEPLMSIVPQQRELAVALYMRAMDVPLIEHGQKVQLLFDGWQAFVVSGWSNATFGTFRGEVVAIDNIPNDLGEFRILVKSDDPNRPFPDLLRVGAGAQGIALLKDVPVWYELWRQLNGFPPDFYQNDIHKANNKFKPPVKSVAK